MTDAFRVRRSQAGLRGPPPSPGPAGSPTEPPRVCSGVPGRCLTTVPGANAQVLAGFIDALDLQDITMVVHDVGGPVGFLVATEQPERFRGLVISNTFGWPLAGYQAFRRTLRDIASPLFAAVNDLTNVMALFTASSCGMGRKMGSADRRPFLSPRRSVSSPRATQQILAGVLRIDPVMAEVELSLGASLTGPPVLTLFGRQNDRYGCLLSVFWDRVARSSSPALPGASGR